MQVSRCRLLKPMMRGVAALRDGLETKKGAPRRRPAKDKNERKNRNVSNSETWSVGKGSSGKNSLRCTLANGAFAVSI